MNEWLSLHPQHMNEWLSLHPQQSFQDYLQARPDAAVQTAVATLVGGSGQVALLKAIQAATPGSAEQYAAARQTDDNQQYLQELDKLAADSKLRRRSAQTFREFIRAVAQDSAAPDLYISAEALQQSGLAEQLAAVSPEIAEQLPDALISGGDVRIPVSDYAGRIAGTPSSAALQEHLHSGAMTMSKTEAADYLQSEQAAKLENFVDRAFQDQPQPHTVEQTPEEQSQPEQTPEAQRSAHQAGVETVRQAVKNQLDKLGRFSPKVHELYAGLHSAYFGTMAERLGVSAEQLFAHAGLNVQAMKADGLFQDGRGQNPEDLTADRQQDSQTGQTPEQRQPPSEAETASAAGHVDENPQAHENIDYRGSFNPATNTIALYPKADLSTFLHESGHFFLNMQFNLARGLQHQAKAAAGESEFYQEPKKHPGGHSKVIKAGEMENRSDDPYANLGNDHVPPGFYSRKTKVVVSGKRTLGADSVNSAHEAAQAMEYLTRNAVEQADGLITDQDGKPLAIVGSFKGSVSDVPVDLHTLAAEAFRVKGAANIWMAHFHPGGSARFSENDRHTNQLITEMFRGSRITPRGYIVYGKMMTGRRTWMFDQGAEPDKNTGGNFLHFLPPSEKSYKVPVVSRELLNEDSLGPDC